MKKILILMVLVATCSTAMKAENMVTLNSNQENYLNYRGNRHYNHHNNNNNNRNNQTSIPKDKLPSGVVKYLDKNYPGNEIMISKQKSDGYFYVKIRYNQNANRPYYRNLVFDQKGNPVRG